MPAPTIRAVKGMNDVLPADIGRWHRVEAAFARTMALHGYREVRTPYVEPTPLFVRAIGEAGLWGAAILTLFTGYDYLRTGLAHMTGAPVGVDRRAQHAKPQAQPRTG